MKIPFTVSARTARLIGRENVSNAEGAIIELIKNSYDADAKNVILSFTSKNEIVLIDNGQGMDKSTIQNSWMRIGTDNKSKNPYTLSKRIKAGAKGIGRFALDRLGHSAELYTLPKDKKIGYHWKIDWTDFEKDDATVTDVNAELLEINNLNLKNTLDNQVDNNSFNIDFSSGGTILIIRNPREAWTDETITKLYHGLESLVPEMDDDSFSISLSYFKEPNKFGLVRPLVQDDFDYQISANYDAKEGLVKVCLRRNEFDIDDLEKKHIKVFEQELMTSFPFNLVTFKNKYFEQKFNILDILKGYKNNKDDLSQIGDFRFNLIFAKNTAPNREDYLKYPYKIFDYSKRSYWMKRFGGIKVFRDNFRVRPYGEAGEDWLKLGERAAKSPAGVGQNLSGYKIRPNQIAGSVYISRISNVKLEDKSSREGLLENQTFELFKEVLLAIISIVEKDRNTIFYSLSQLNKNTSENEKIKAAAKDALKRIAVDSKNKKLSTPEEVTELKNDATTVAKVVAVLENEIVEKHEEIKILRSLASAGLITAAVAHELRGLKSVLLVRNSELRKLMSPFISEDSLKDKDPAYNPYVLLNEMEKTDKNLHEWLSYALTPLKRDKRLRKNVIIKHYFEDLKIMWTHLLNERRIKLNITDFPETYLLKVFLIDLDTIFNNLIINSIESFARMKMPVTRNITIGVIEIKDYYKISYTDNGSGLDEVYKNRPTDIFLPQETTKKGNGTGMGMYLVKSVIDDNNGKAEILLPKQGFSINLHLPVIKSTPI